MVSGLSVIFDALNRKAWNLLYKEINFQDNKYFVHFSFKH